MDDTVTPTGARAETAQRPMAKITVKLFAMLEQHLPPQRAAKHEALMEFPEGVTPVDILARLNVPRNVVHLTLVNGFYIPPGDFEKTVLKDGDTIAMWPPIAGGAHGSHG